MPERCAVDKHRDLSLLLIIGSNTECGFNNSCWIIDDKFMT